MVKPTLFGLDHSGGDAVLGDLTLAATKNIDLTDARFDKTGGRRATGRDCRMLLLGFPTQDLMR